MSATPPSPELPPASPSPEIAAPDRAFRGKVVLVVTTALAAFLLTNLIISIAQVLTLAFAGVLLAVCLSAPSELLAKYTHLPRGYALAIVLASLLVLIAGLAYVAGRTIETQINELSVSVPNAMRALEADLQRDAPGPSSAPTVPVATQPGPIAATSAPSTAPAAPPSLPGATWLAGQTAKLHALLADLLTSESFYRGAGGAITTTFGAIGNVVVILVIGLFFAFSPRMYINGFVALVPISKRPRAREILARAGNTLQWWFVGQLLSMTVITILTGIGLMILGVPAALALALLAGLMTFIPNFGPFIAAIPAVLLALAPHGAQTTLNLHLAVYVICLYVGVQMLDGTLITPTIQKRAVAIPPALIMLAQVTLAVLLGPLGLLLATPILAAVLVLIRAIYIEDILGDKAAAAGPARK